MKVHIELELTPEEARTFLGLPDMAPIHDALTSQARSKIETLGNAVDIEPLVKTWGSMGGLATDAITSVLSAALRPSSRSSRDTPDKDQTGT